MRRLVSLAIFALSLTAAANAQPPDGAALFTRRCASCHQNGTETRAPAPEVLKERSPESIIDALTGGAMRYQ